MKHKTGFKYYVVYKDEVVEASDDWYDCTGSLKKLEPPAEMYRSEPDEDEDTLMAYTTGFSLGKGSIYRKGNM